MEDWELVLHEIYRSDPDLAKQRGAKKINASKLSDELGIENKELAMKLSLLKEQGFITEKNKKLQITKKGVHYYAQNTALKEVKRGLLMFTSSLLLSTFFNFINWLRIFNPWLLLAIFFLCISIINFISVRFLK